MKKIIKAAAAVTALILLLSCAAPALADDGEQPTVILLLVGDGTYDTYYPSAAFYIVLDPARSRMRVVNFDMSAQIYADTPQAGETYIPMSFLSYCETDAIIAAYESTFGVPIDRYLFFAYQYGSFFPMLSMLDTFCPVELDIPEALTGDAEYYSVNGNIPWIAGEAGREYTLTTGAEAQALDAVGVVAYFASFPQVDFDTLDWNQYTMDNARLWQEKSTAVFDAITPALRKPSIDGSNAFWMMMLDGQETNITQKDIDAWKLVPYTPSDNALLNVPMLDAAIVQEFTEASAFTDANLYPHMMLTYDIPSAAADIQAFVAGD